MRLSDHSDAVGVGYQMRLMRLLCYQMCLAQFLGGAELVCQV